MSFLDWGKDSDVWKCVDIPKKIKMKIEDYIIHLYHLNIYLKKSKTAFHKGTCISMFIVRYSNQGMQLY